MIDYFVRPEIPGVQAFRCEKLSATLSVQNCATMWKQANHQNVERVNRCKTCPIGALHAGETAASMSPMMGRCMCARCHHTATRLIGKHLCISCYNRQREWIIGRNSKGCAPTKMKPLARRSVRYFSAGQPATLTLEHTVDTIEMIVTVLRDCRQRVTFAFNGMPQGILQGRLF